MNRFFASALLLVTGSAWGSEGGLVSVSSTYVAKVGSLPIEKSITLKGTGTPIGFIHQGRPLVAVFTSSHVSGGIAGSLRVTSSEGREVPILARCSDAAHDVELLVADPAELSPIGDFDGDQFNIFPEAVRALQGTAIAVNDGIFGEVLAPVSEWAARRPQPAVQVSEVRDADFAERLLSGRHTELGRLPVTVYGDEIASDAAIAPGMSGAPLILRLGQMPRSPLKAFLPAEGEATLIGITSRVMVDFPRSYFASARALKSLLKRFQDGKCGTSSSAVWMYHLSEQGDGITYRIFETPFGKMSEASPDFARAGNGASDDGGAPLLSAQAPSVEISNNRWESLGIRPGILLELENGKDRKSVIAFSATPKLGGRVLDLFADASAIDFLLKRNDQYSFSFLTVDDVNWSELLRRRVSVRSKRLSLRGGVMDGYFQLHGRTHRLDVKGAKIYVALDLPEKRLRFALDRKGIVEGSKAAFFTPIVKVQGCAVDLTRLFFVDVSRVFKGNASLGEFLNFPEEHLDRELQFHQSDVPPSLTVNCGPGRSTSTTIGFR